MVQTYCAREVAFCFSVLKKVSKWVFYLVLNDDCSHTVSVKFDVFNLLISDPIPSESYDY